MCKQISMKKISPILVFLLLSAYHANSTVETFRHFIYPNLNFSICYNHSQWEPIHVLYYKGLSQLLNEYISHKVKNSELESKKFEIQILSAVFGSNQEIEISQNKNGYFVFIHGNTNLTYLVKVVNYFVSDNWQSFCFRSSNRDAKKRALDTFNKILKSVGTPNMDFFESKKAILWELDELQIAFENDQLNYYLSGKKLFFQPSSPLPAKLNDRFFLAGNDSIHVFENNKEILKDRIPMQKNATQDCYSLKVDNTRLYLYCFDRPILRYSHEENKFFNMKK